MRICSLIVSALLTACGSRPLPNAHESPQALSRAVLAAIEQRDADALRMLALNKADFIEHVWPELPSARPERNLTAVWVWGDLNQKSNIMLRETLAEHSGRKYTLISVRFLGATTQHMSYRVHRESELSVRDASGTERNLRVFGSVIEKDGRYKVFSYVVDD